MEELPRCEMSSSSAAFHRAAGSAFMQNASSDAFFSSCLNQKAKYVLRLELDSRERWLRVPQLLLRAGGCVEVKGFAEAPDFSRAGSDQTMETQFIFSSFLISLSFFPPSLPVTWQIYSQHQLDI